MSFPARKVKIYSSIVFAVAIAIASIVAISIQWYHSHKIDIGLQAAVADSIQKGDKAPHDIKYTFKDIDGMDVVVKVKNGLYQMVFTNVPDANDNRKVSISNCRKLASGFLDLPNIEDKNFTFQAAGSMVNYLIITKVDTEKFLDNSSKSLGEARAETNKKMRAAFITSLCDGLKYAGTQPSTIVFTYRHNDKQSKKN